MAMSHSTMQVAQAKKAEAATQAAAAAGQKAGLPPTAAALAAAHEPAPVRAPATTETEI